MDRFDPLSVGRFSRYALKFGEKTAFFNAFVYGRKPFRDFRMIGAGFMEQISLVK
jgi:hypothetical protein